jgi:hypothetical protein
MLPQNRPQPREEIKNKLMLSKIDFCFGWKSSYQSKILKFNVSSALQMNRGPLSGNHSIAFNFISSLVFPEL